MVPRTISQPSQSGLQNGFKAKIGVQRRTSHRVESTRSNAACARQAAQSVRTHACFGVQSHEEVGRPSVNILQHRIPAAPNPLPNVGNPPPNISNLAQEAEASRLPVDPHFPDDCHPVPQAQPRPPSKDHAHLPLTAYERLNYQRVLKDNESLRKQVEQLTLSLSVAMEKNKDKPPFCDRENVKRHLTDIVTKILLGNTHFSSMYPSDETLIEAILTNFNAHQDQYFKSVFLKEWGLPGEANGLRHLVLRNVANRRGALTRYAKDELYFLLGVPKPLFGAPCNLINKWHEDLEVLREDDSWQKSINVNGHIDPYGSTAFHGAIARAIHGGKYSKVEPVSLTIDQGGFFLHVLELAMVGKTLNPLDMHSELRMMKEAKKKLLQSQSQMQRVLIVMNGNLDDEFGVDDEDGGDSQVSCTPGMETNLGD